jgi:hypothetical protein
MSKPLDSDIAATKLSDGEKWGLQIFRNYSQAFGEHRAKVFVEQLAPFDSEVSLFEQITALVVSEESRIVPVIACSYADDRMLEMFKREVPEGVPGGRSGLMSGFGPLARFSQRIQMAFAFGWLSKDLLTELDHLRKVRNDISHKWDVALIERRLEELINEKQYPLEEQLGDGVSFPEDFHESMSPIDRFRVRTVWLLGRLTYEARLWVPALNEGIKPVTVLYGANTPEMLRKIVAICIGATKVLAEASVKNSPNGDATGDRA